MAPGGYAWWYIDALSDDGQCALVAIIFIGSVFSPYYARARRRSATAGRPMPPAEQHVAINLALYRPGRSGRWTMTERGGSALKRTRDHIQIGPSHCRWDGDMLELQVDEWAPPWPLPGRVQGRIRLFPLARGTPAPLPLDAAGQHHWWPLAPISRIEVDLPQPGWHWRGSAYLDSNRGAEPIERGFAHWHWARAALDRRHSAVVYDTTRRDGSQHALALRFDARGGCETFALPPTQDLPATGWRIGRQVRTDANAIEPARVLHTLQDAPFYARSLVQARWLGQPVIGMHESLRLDRFESPLVQAMLPFRMPRRG